MKYSGIYVGTGKWTISEINGQSLITYKIDHKIQSNLIRLLSAVLPVATTHFKLMKEVLTGLERFKINFSCYNTKQSWLIGPKKRSRSKQIGC